MPEKYIFVISKGTLDPCQFSQDLQITAVHACKLQIIRLEPLVHWGTVTPVSVASQSTFIFRRNGELMQKPEYIHLVRRLFDTEASTYCVDCLEHLWKKRGEARETMKQLQCAVKQLDPCESEEAFRPQMNLKTRVPGVTSSDGQAVAVGRSMGKTAHDANPEEVVDMYKDFVKVSGADALASGQNSSKGRQAMPHLDGSSSDFGEIDFNQAPSATRKDDTIWVSSDSDEPLKHLTAPAKPTALGHSFTLPLRRMSTSPKSSFGQSSRPAPVPSITVRSSTSTRTDRVSKNITGTDRALASKNSPQIIDLITPPRPRIKERKFGRELNTNTTASPTGLRRSPRKNKSNPVLQENLVPPVQPMKPLKTLTQTQTSTKETKKRKMAPLLEQTVKQKKQRMSILKDPTVPQAIAQRDLLGPPQVPKPESAVRPPSPVKLIVNFAKRPAGMNIPDGVATLIYEEFQDGSPAPSAKICSCNKPAGHSTFKKNDQPHISQCTNPNCRFRWYHYACLNLSDKGKARFGNLFCQLCRNEQEFAERDKMSGRSLDKWLDFKMPWTKEDIEAQIPGLGGHVPAVNPYGLGTEIELAPAYHTETQTKGTLGALEMLGYPQSHPYMLEEAYCNPDAYAGLRADLAGDEEGDEGRWYERRAGGDEYSYDDEMVDVETEEEV